MTDTLPLESLQEQLTARRSELSVARQQAVQLEGEVRDLEQRVVQSELAAAFDRDGPAELMRYLTGQLRRRGWVIVRNAVRRRLRQQNPRLTFPDGQLDDGNFHIGLQLRDTDSPQDVRTIAHILNTIADAVRTAHAEDNSLPGVTVLVTLSLDGGNAACPHCLKPHVALRLHGPGWALEGSPFFVSGSADVQPLLEEAWKTTPLANCTDMPRW